MRTLAQVLAESKHINLSLHYLEMCITALHDRAVHPERHSHVPYRNCMMTSVLKDSLGGNCKVRTRLVFVLLMSVCLFVFVSFLTVIYWQFYSGLIGYRNLTLDAIYSSLF